MKNGEGLQCYSADIKTLMMGLPPKEPYKVVVKCSGKAKSKVLATIIVTTIDSTFDQEAQEAGFKNIMNQFPDYAFSQVQQIDKNHHGSFIAERAYKNLKILNDFGPKVVGSYANEHLATNFILNHIKEIKNNATNPNDIEIDHQISSNDDYPNYINIQNIVVRVQGESNHTLLLNCHYDSEPQSPGASDDTVSCCVMIEILRILSQKSSLQRHTVLFLFNGAEETGLQGSHAFITQHHWNESINAFINLESIGSGGREILFRTGPKHDWLVRMYRQSVPRPFGHAISEELFESGVIPSATDFEIFRFYGNVPGLDFAYVEDGWRYHTRYDSIDYIPLESIQYTGNNILALTLKIANSNELVDPPEGTYAIFFDYLGLFFISYTAETGTIFNYIIAVLAVTIPFILQTKFKFENIFFILFETSMSFITIVISTVISAAICCIMAGIMYLTDNTMSYYNTTFLSVGIYCSLALIIQIGTYHVIQYTTNRIYGKRKKYREASKRRRVKISLNGVNLFWSMITIMLTSMGFRFAYISMILLLLSLCTYLLMYFTFRYFRRAARQNWIFIHLLGHSIVFLFTCYLMIQINEFFIPMTGTFGSNINPDIVIALISVLWMVLCMSYFIPLTLLVRYRAILYTTLSAIFIISTILSFTPIGFPYSGNKEEPRLQRFQTIHMATTIYDENNNVNSSFSKVMTYGWDINGMRTMKNTFGDEVMIEEQYEICEEHYSCNFAFYHFTKQMIVFKNYDKPPNIEPTKFNLINSTRNENNTEIEFALELRTLTYLEVAADEGLDCTYVRKQITVGLQPKEPYRVIVKCSGAPKTNILARIIVATIDSTFDQGAQEEGFKKIMYKFPNYTFSHIKQIDFSVYQVVDE